MGTREDKMKLFNLTPHQFDISNRSGLVSLPADGRIARVRAEYLVVGEIHKILIYEECALRVTSLPPPKDGNLYLVSKFAYRVAHLLGRNDVVTAFRDDWGDAIGLMCSKTV